MTLQELAELTKELQAIEIEILDAARHGRVDDYPELRVRLEEARAIYDELVARTFELD